MGSDALWLHSVSQSINLIYLANRERERDVMGVVVRMGDRFHQRDLIQFGVLYYRDMLVRAL